MSQQDIVDCTFDLNRRCGELAYFANLSTVPVKIEVQYPHDATVWYTIAALEPGGAFQQGPASLSFPGSTVLRASHLSPPPGTPINDASYYMLGAIIPGQENALFVPTNAFVN